MTQEEIKDFRALKLWLWIGWISVGLSCLCPCMIVTLMLAHQLYSAIHVIAYLILIQIFYWMVLSFVKNPPSIVIPIYVQKYNLNLLELDLDKNT